MAAGAADAGLGTAVPGTAPNGGTGNGGSSRGNAATKARIATVAAGLLGIVVGAGAMALVDGDDADFRGGMRAGQRGPGMSNAQGGQRLPGADTYPFSDGDEDGRFPGHYQDGRGGSPGQEPQSGDQDDQGEFMPPSGGPAQGRSRAS